MRQVIVDADACPRSCLQTVRKYAGKYIYTVITVASFNHQIDNENHLVVGNEPQATDIAVINLVRAGDIVVTQDWGLAAMVLGKNGRAIAPKGLIYRPERMELMLEERNILARYRKGGGRTKGPAKRTGEDDREFESSFLQLLDERETDDYHDPVD